MSSQREKQTQPTSNINATIRHKNSPRTKHQFTCLQESRTKQSFKDECDINRIMARYQATGQLPNINEIPPQYLDVTAMDFQEHQNFIAGAFSIFNELPSGIRTRFSNNPAEFLDFCSQDKNRPELTEMGLLRPIVDPVIPMPTQSTPAAPAASNPAA